MAAPSPVSSSSHQFLSPPPQHPSPSDTLQLIDELWFCGNILRWPGLRLHEEAMSMAAAVADGSEMSDPLVKVRDCVCEDESGVRAECGKWKAGEALNDPRMKLNAEIEEYAGQTRESAVNIQIGGDPPFVMYQQNQKTVELVKEKKKENGEDLESAIPSAQEKTHQPVRKFQLETINSGKLLVAEVKPTIQVKRRQRVSWRKRNKSLTDLEFYELKGIRDLGFNLSEDELTPRVISLVPGLKSYNKHSSVSSSPQAESTRLYPSADWWTSEKEPPLQSWKIPYPQSEGVDMKEQLKFWAHAVASTMRQEC